MEPTHTTERLLLLFGFIGNVDKTNVFLLSLSLFLFFGVFLFVFFFRGGFTSGLFLSQTSPFNSKQELKVRQKEMNIENM